MNFEYFLQANFHGNIAWWSIEWAAVLNAYIRSQFESHLLYLCMSLDPALIMFALVLGRDLYAIQPL